MPHVNMSILASNVHLHMAEAAREKGRQSSAYM